MDSKLTKIFNNDEFGLLNEENKTSPVTHDDRLIDSFLEINNFYTQNGREPKSRGDIHEHKLATRLKNFKEDSSILETLKKYDQHNFLSNTTITENKEGILEDEFGLLDIDDSSIFKIKNVPEISKDRSGPDFVATRQQCDDFDKFEPLFVQCQSDLKKGIKKMGEFIESDMKEGDFFVMSGILLYIDKIYDPYRGNSNKINKRTRCIYENGLESNILLRSLGKRLAENGFAVRKASLAEQINEEDETTGYIYILQSLSENPKISNLKDLYKIGFSTTEVEERIKNAETDPTYLMSPVKIVESIKCFNLDPQRFERLIHRFFSAVCLDVQIADKNGLMYTPKEWFIVPVEIIEKVIDLIVRGEIINYSYDRVQKVIVRK